VINKLYLYSITTTHFIHKLFVCLNTIQTIYNHCSLKIKGHFLNVIVVWTLTFGNTRSIVRSNITTLAVALLPEGTGYNPATIFDKVIACPSTRYTSNSRFQLTFTSTIFIRSSGQR